MGIDEAHAMHWEPLKQMLIKGYCPGKEVQALEKELWNLTMKGSKVATYTSRFNDLAKFCTGMVTSEDKEIEGYT